MASIHTTLRSGNAGADHGSRMRGPDFFIVGAPKCGTTALTDYLAQHPEVGMCERKETQYFATDLYPKFGREDGAWITPEEYLRLFTHAQGRKRIGEASVWYLYSAAAPAAIRAFAPNADIIVMLRNPLEALPSLHSQFVFVGIEPVEDFEAALALDPERERSGSPPGFPPRSYRSAARYGEQVRRYVETFGRDRLHVILYDDFSADTLGSFRRTCEFVGVDPGFLPEIRVVNPNKRVRARWAQDLVQDPPPALRRLLHASTPQRLRRRLGATLKRWNTRYEPRRPASESAAEALRPLVAQQVEELRELLGLDASRWLAAARLPSGR